MHKKKISPILVAFILSLILSLAIFSVAFAFHGQTILDMLGPAASLSPSQGDNSDAGLVSKPVASTSFDEYISKTIFIGDSRTNGLGIYNFVPLDNVYAIDGANHQTARTERFLNLGTGKKLTIAEAVGIKKPERLIVSFGINGVAFMGEEKFMSEYAAFIDELKMQSPDSILIIQSILPVSYERARDNPQMANTVIDRYNLLLRVMAYEKGGRFLDTSSLLKDSRNALASKYDSGDGLHFNQSAYQALLNYLDNNRIN